jgi:hypothetical protein
MKTFHEFLTIDEATKGDDWTPPLAGHAIAKHLGKAHIKGIVSDEDFRNYVHNREHFPVFRVKHGTGGYKDVRVGNTLGDHHIHYTINRAGTVQRKVVYSRSDGVHPGVHWAVHSSWSLQDEMDKKKGKK